MKTLAPTTTTTPRDHRVATARARTRRQNSVAPIGLRAALDLLHREPRVVLD